MLSVERNLFMTRVGRGQPMGELFRQFWLPLTLSEQLPERDGDPVRLRLLGEDLVVFRDTNGQIGAVGAFCPHRRAPLRAVANSAALSQNGVGARAVGNLVQAGREER